MVQCGQLLALANGGRSKNLLRYVVSGTLIPIGFWMLAGRVAAPRVNESPLGLVRFDAGNYFLLFAASGAAHVTLDAASVLCRAGGSGRQIFADFFQRLQIYGHLPQGGIQLTAGSSGGLPRFAPSAANFSLHCGYLPLLLFNGCLIAGSHGSPGSAIEGC